MAQVKLLKIGNEGYPLEFNTATDDITLNSFTVQGGGPVLGTTGLDMNNEDIVDIKDLDFNDPSTATIDQTSGPLIVDDLMFQTKENVMTTSGAILFPVITDVADEVDSFSIPQLAGAPTATPSDSGEAFLVWDSVGKRPYIWNGTLWDDMFTVADAENVVNFYTAGESIAARDVVYISSSDTVSRALGNSSSTARVIGFNRSAAVLSETVSIISNGTIGGFTGLTPGVPQYLDATTPGAITESIPTGAGNIIVRVGYAKNATTVDVKIEQLGARAA